MVSRCSSQPLRVNTLTQIAVKAMKLRGQFPLSSELSSPKLRNTQRDWDFLGELKRYDLQSDARELKAPRYA